MNVKRVSIATGGVSFVAYLYTYKVVKRMLTICKKVKINISNASIEALREKYSGEEIPEDRLNLKEWLSEAKTEYSQEEFTNTENFNRICSEILNACEQEDLETSSISFFTESDEKIVVKIFTKNQPNSEKEMNDFGDSWYGFDNSEIKILELNCLFNRSLPENEIISFLKSREIVSNLLIFEDKEGMMSFINEAKEKMVSLNDEFSYFISNTRHQINFDKPVEDNIWELIGNYSSYLDGLSGENKEKMLKKSFEEYHPNFFFRNEDNYIQKGVFENLIQYIDFGNYEWSITHNGTEINIKIENGQVSFDKEICPTCGSILLQKLTTPFGTECCQNCIEDVLGYARVHSYHSDTISNPQESCGEKPSEKARYGIELEMIQNYDFSESDWYQNMAPIVYSEGNLAKFEHDGSLGDEGEEMITQPLNKNFILGDKMKKWLDTCSSLYHPESCCGLHVHVDKSALSIKEWGGVIRFVANNYEKFVEKGIFRQPSYYCQINHLKNLASEQDDEELGRKFFSSHDHYSYISNSGHTGRTVEFRCFDSTTDYDEFSKRIKTIMILLDNAESLSNERNISIS